MTDREIMQQALEALEYHTMQTRPISHTDKAIEALRQALAQPEPVVSFTDNEEGLWIQLACNGSYYSQNLSESKTAKFFVNAYRGRK
jgi:hypothetical protein